MSFFEVAASSSARAYTELSHGTVEKTVDQNVKGTMETFFASHRTLLSVTAHLDKIFLATMAATWAAKKFEAPIPGLDYLPSFFNWSVSATDVPLILFVVALGLTAHVANEYEKSLERRSQDNKLQSPLRNHISVIPR